MKLNTKPIQPDKDFPSAMTTYTIDTHETVRQFVAAIIPDKQAEVIVAVISRTDSDLATKADLTATVAGLKADMLMPA